jgi:GMP synthase-like glutamine amidotransferase
MFIVEKTFSIKDNYDNVALDSNTKASNQSKRTLNLAMLGCETKQPYGPLDHTAQLLMELLGMAMVHAAQSVGETESVPFSHWEIRLHVYSAPDMEYPNDWDVYDGILIPGSFSSAYDTDPWIEQLKVVIQERIVSHHRPTLAICFGHQILAHSFHRRGGGGLATPTPSGPRAGRFEMPLLPAGNAIFKDCPISSDKIFDTNGCESAVQLYFTHGDMVSQIPDVAVPLGGDSAVPIQAAAYFVSPEDATRYRRLTLDDAKVVDIPKSSMPYAFTLQAHPEYSSSMDLGVYRTLFQCMDAMEQRHIHCTVPPREDVIDNFGLVQNHSIAVVARIGQVLGWFPHC